MGRKILVLIAFIFNFLIGYSQTIPQDSLLYSSTVEFIVNTDNFLRNEDYAYFINTTVPFIHENADDIECIILIGSASPEGNKERNKYLAKIRADKIHSYFSEVPRRKINIINDYDLFLEKTGASVKDYERLRATYIEIYFKRKCPEVKADTVYVKETVVDTIIDTVYIKEKIKPRTIPILGVKTNLVADIAITPNVQAELYTHFHGISLEFAYTFPWWSIDYDKYFYYQILNGTAGIRKYFNDNYTGHYIGIYGNTAIYDICFSNKDEGWQGELYGCGVSYGYVFQNKKHPRWKFEPYIRLGWFNTKFDTYHASQPWNEKYYYNWYLKASDFKPRRFDMTYFGPTAIGFNLTFDLICIKKY